VYLDIIGVVNMKLSKVFSKALTATIVMLDDYAFKCSNRIKSSYFTRERAMGFKDNVLFILNMINKSLQVELNNFFEVVLKKDTTISKQAFSVNRQKINPHAFIELNDRINQVIYQECDEYILWNGYRLSAVDGTTLELPNTEELRKEFGYAQNQRSQVARAKATCIFDLKNTIVIKSKIDRVGTSEREMAKELILDMIKDSNFKELILFDRGYPSNELITTLIENKVYFVMRSASNHYIKKINPQKNDQKIIIKYKNKDYLVRVIKFKLDSGIEEILLTNLFDENYKVEDFKALYFMRWGIEVKYDELKNRLEIENFSGETKIAIEQDFYASIYLSNMLELANQDSDKKIRQEQEGKEIKYVYKTNSNILVGSLKDKLILMLLEKSTRKRHKMYKEIIEKLSNNRIPIRPNRQNPRPDRMSRSKYRRNRKRSL